MIESDGTTYTKGMEVFFSSFLNIIDGTDFATCVSMAIKLVRAWKQINDGVGGEFYIDCGEKGDKVLIQF